MSRDIRTPEPAVAGSGVLLFGSGWLVEALVALGGVEDEFAEEFAGGGVDDADVGVLDKDVGPSVGSSDADGVELPAVTQGDLAGFVDAVAAEPFVGFVGGVLAGLGVVGSGGGGVPGQGAVRSATVVLVGEGVDQGL
jgi:hypothetical protein